MGEGSADAASARPPNVPDARSPDAQDAGAGSPSFVEPPQFSQAGGFYKDSFSLTITSGHPGAEIRYTLDGSEPTAASRLYATPIPITSRAGTPNDISKIPTGPLWQPPRGEVFKGWVVRARAFVPGGSSSATMTRSYWIDSRARARYSLPVLSLATERANLFDSATGIYVPGTAKNGKGGRDGNYFQEGPAWEKPAHVEVYDQNNALMFGQPVVVKIHGNTSQGGFPIKGLDLDATTPNGGRPIAAMVFPDRPRSSFGRLLLRPSGQDQIAAFMRDELVQSLIADTGMYTQAARPVVCFINGEYWGLSYLKEKQNEAYVAAYSKLREDEIDYIESYPTAATTDLSKYVKAGDALHYLMTIDYISKNDPADPSVYSKIQNLIDTNNFIDYRALEIISFRWDMGNHRLWRPRVAGGRWQWLQYDYDVSFGGYSLNGDRSPSFDMLYVELNPNTGGLQGHNTATSTFLLRSLLKNPSFRADFINRSADLLNTLFLPSNVIARIDKMAAALAPEMTEHTSRWQIPASVSEWNGHVQALRDFASRRPAPMRQHLMQNLALAGVATLSVSVSNAACGTVQVNTIAVSAPAAAPWSGVYFKNHPISISATPKAGCRFVGWQGIASDSNRTTTVPMAQDTAITASFAPE